MIDKETWETWKKNKKHIRIIDRDGYLSYENIAYCKDIDNNLVPAKCPHCGGEVISSGLFFVCKNNNEKEPHYIKVRRFKRYVGVPLKIDPTTGKEV